MTSPTKRARTAPKYQCTTCKKHFKDKWRLDQHLLQEHEAVLMPLNDHSKLVYDPEEDISFGSYDGFDVVIKLLPYEHPIDMERADLEHLVLVEASQKSKASVQYYGYTIYDGWMFIIMERCDCDLSELNDRKGPWTEKEFLDISLQVAIALASLHDVKILHRDIKLQNVFYNYNNELVIGDYGLSLLLTDVDEMVSGSVGTPEYMAPEIVDDKAEYGVSVDTYSYGIMLDLLKMNIDEDTDDNENIARLIQVTTEVDPTARWPMSMVVDYLSVLGSESEQAKLINEVAQDTDIATKLDEEHKSNPLKVTLASKFEKIWKYMFTEVCPIEWMISDVLKVTVSLMERTEKSDPLLLLLFGMSLTVSDIMCLVNQSFPDLIFRLFTAQQQALIAARQANKAENQGLVKHKEAEVANE